MQSVLHKFQNMSLIWQFTLVVFFILFIPTILIFIIYIHIFRTSLIDQGKALLQKDLNQLSYTMDSGFDTIDSVIAELNYQQEFAYFLNNKTKLSRQEQDYFTSQLRGTVTKLRNLYPNYFRHIAIYSSNTQIEDSFDYMYDFTYMDRLEETKYASAIINDSRKLIHGKIRTPEYTYPDKLRDDINIKEIDSLIIPVYQKIFSLNSEDLVGVLEINVALDKLIPSSTLTDMDTGIMYFLYDDDKNICYALPSQITASRILADFTQESGLIQGTLDEKNHYFAYSRCEKTGMLRITALSEQILLQPVNSMFTKVTIVTLLALFLIVSLAFLAIKVLLRRLSEMGQMMKKIEVGDFDIHVNENGSDEISRIAKSFNKMGTRLKDTIHSLVTQEKMQKETELRALEAQINPHFLYNTLETMRMQCEIDEYYQVSDGLAALSDLFRYSVKWTDGEVPFALEWKNLKDYVSIMQLRHESNLHCILDYQDDTGDMDEITVPKLILQPLIENCFNHGFRNQFPPFELYISARMDASDLLITIQDNGAGMNRERLTEIQTAFTQGIPIKRTNSHHSIGLHNVMQRIEMLCRPGSHIEITSEENHGTTICIHILV